MTAPVRYKVEDGKKHRIQDLGCADLELAALNRKRVANDESCSYWFRLEAGELEEHEKPKELTGVFQAGRKR